MLSTKWCLWQVDLQDPLTPHKTLDLTSSLEVGPTASNNGKNIAAYSARSILTIAFQFPFESNLQENVATMARQYVRSVISSVQRVAMAISPSGSGPAVGPKLSPASPEALTLAHWICQSYRYIYLCNFTILKLLTYLIIDEILLESWNTLFL